MKRTVAIQDVHNVHGKPRHNQVLHVYHNWTDEELADEANVVRQNDIEFRRLKRFIEAHDEILAVLSETARVLGPLEERMRRLEPDYRPLRAAILIWIPLVLLGCAVVYYRVVTP